jgi:hypothetical protein
MPIHIFEHNGVLLQVDYFADTKPVTINSVHALGTDYKPIGPDLTPLLEEALVLTGATEAEHFLSLVAKEL